MMRKLLLGILVLVCGGLWAWYLLDLQGAKRVHGQLRQCITEDVRAALVVYKPEALMSMMRESSVYRAMQDTTGWGRATHLMHEYLALRDESVKIDQAHAPLMILFGEDGSVRAAMDAYYLKTVPQNLHHGCALTAEGMKTTLQDTLLDRAWAATGGKYGTLITRFAPSVLTDEMASADGWASLELDVADERWHLFGYAFHPKWALARPDSNENSAIDEGFGLKGNTFSFGHYPDFLAVLAQNASPEWTLRRNAVEDSCQCALRDVFSDWHTGRVEYWTGAEGAVLTFEVAPGVTDFAFAAPLTEDAAQPQRVILWPSLPGVAFGLSEHFPVIKSSKNTLSFATSEGAFARYRNADAIPAHRGTIKNAHTRRVIQKNHPLLAPRSEELTATQTLRFESATQTYVQVTIGTGSVSVKGRDNMLWLAMTGAAPADQLHVVTNHNSREKEILLQDTEGTTYLIGAGGNVLWNKKLEGRIMGTVTQVDLLKNGKLQMAFNTDKALYVLDRNGNPTEGFPVKLPTEASGPVGVFDYEQNKDYRFIVPLSDGNVLNISAKGQPVKGWQYIKGPSPIVRTEHWMMGKNDFLICLAADGEIKTLQRNGTPKWMPAGKAAGLGKNFFLRKENTLEDSYVIYQANDSLLRMATFGQAGPDDLPTPGIQWSRWFYGQVNADSRADMMLISDNLCTLLLNGSENEILIPLDELPSSPPVIVQRPEGDNYILFDQPKAGHIMAFRLSGEPVEGFPLEGSAPFAVTDLNLNGRLNVVVSGSGEVVCFELK